jgi:hypothetical protein
MRNKKRWIFVILVIAGLQLAACKSDTATHSEPAPVELEHIEGTDFNRVMLSARAAERLDIQTGSVLEQEIMRDRTILGLEDFDPDEFDRPTTIDNPWLPLTPGTRWVLDGTTTEGDETLAHRIEFTVTDLTKEIEGVPTVVAWIADYSEDELVEKEIAFYAQDNNGNVWFLGEHPEEYEDGELVDAPTWIAGLQGARAGIAMKADPQAGTPSYPQGWAPAVEWTDRGQVAQVGQQTCVPVDCYDEVLVIEEFNPEPNAFQLKYYAPAVGFVAVGWRGTEASREELELVELVQLDPDALAEVRAQALALEQHAYQISPNVYAHTPRAERLTDAAGGETAGPGPVKVVPYAAVIYGVHGETWVYTNPEPLVFIREPITIDYIEGDLAVLSEGPPAGTAVVTVGGSELFGAESGIGGGGGH